MEVFAQICMSGQHKNIFKINLHQKKKKKKREGQGRKEKENLVFSKIILLFQRILQFYFADEYINMADHFKFLPFLLEYHKYVQNS